MRKANVHQYLYGRKAELFIAIYAGKGSCRELGRLVGVSASSISRFLRSEEWKAWRLHLVGDPLMELAVQNYPADKWEDIEGSNSTTHQEVLAQLVDRYPFLFASTETLT